MIPIGSLSTGRVCAGSKAEEELLAKRERAAKAAQIFPAQNGISDLVGPPAGLEQKVQRSIQRAVSTYVGSVAEHRARMDRIPAEVQRRATEKGVGDQLLLMETVAHVYRSSLRAPHSGLAVPVIASDVARSLKAETHEAFALLDRAVGAGLLRRDAKTYTGGTYRVLV